MNAPKKPAPRPRTDFGYFNPISTRWMDNDVYGHVNNVVYYSWFDTAVNAYLVEQGVLDPATSAVIGLVVNTTCNYFSSVAFPDMIEAGVTVAHIGKSSVRYEVGIFKKGAPLTAAHGHFVHVYVDRVTQRPVPLPDALREALLRLQPSAPGHPDHNSAA